ncbi:MAG: MFS transporter [Synergistaceae bacterium]|jgi:MFS family permease|nr:MFS transporter [Synergistaceae bacterium]
MPGFAKRSDDTKLLINLFLPFLMIHCVEQSYLVYGNVLQGYGISPEWTGWILGVFFMTVLLTRPLGGWVLENFGIRTALVWSGAVTFLGCASLLFTKSAPLLLLGRGLSGVGFGVYTTGLFSHQAMCASEKTRGAMLSLLATGGIIPMATVAPLGEWLVIGSRETLYLLIGPVLSAVCWFFGRGVRMPKSAGRAETPGRGGKKIWGTYRELLSSRTFVILSLTGMLVSLVDAIVVTLSLLAAEQGLVASYFLAVGSLTAVIVRVAGAPILNVLPRGIFLGPCGIIVSCGMLLVSFAPSNGSFIVGGLLYGVGIGAGWPMFLALLSDTLEPALRPKGTATALILYDAGWFLTPLLVGYLSAVIGIAWTFAVISLISGALLAFLEIFFWVPLHKAKKRGAICG